MPDSDEQLERELGDRIRSYAASGDRPVDPVVVTARTTGSRRAPSGWGGRFRPVLGAAAGIAVVLVTLSIGVLIASGSLGTRVPAGGTPPPASGVASAPVASPSAEPSVSPSATAIDTSPPASASSTAAPSVTAPTNGQATAAPSTSAPASSATSPAGASAVPSSFAPRSVTFVSPDEGFVLGSVPCPSGACAALARTADAGRTWTSVAAPATTISPPTPDAALGEAGIGGIRFADAADGWGFGPDLWSTHDGGRTWTRIDRSAVGGRVLALGTAGGTTHLVVDDGQGRFLVVTSPATRDDFRATGVALPVGAGPVPELQLVLSGDAGWVLQNDRTVVNGARLRGGTWSAWTPVCADVVGPAYLAASSATDLVAACDVGLWADPKGGHLYLSRDGGTTAAEAGTKIPVALSGSIASGSSGTVVVSGTTDAGSVLEGTFDGGTTWSKVLDLGDAQAVDLGFTTPDQGVVVAVEPSGAARFFMTRDGGRTWSAVAF